MNLIWSFFFKPMQISELVCKLKLSSELLYKSVMRYTDFELKLESANQFTCNSAMPSRTQQTVPSALKALTLTPLSPGSTQISSKVRTPPCLAIRRHRWLPSRARVIRLSTAIRKTRSDLRSFNRSTLDW